MFSDIAVWVEKMNDFELKTEIGYRSSDYICLDDFKIKKDTTLESVIVNRKLRREFVEKPVELGELDYILRHSMGIIQENSRDKKYPYPMAGGIQCVKALICINYVKKVMAGLYLYNEEENKLEYIVPFDSEDYDLLTGSVDLAKQSAFSIHLIGYTNNICYKYQDRGYRFLLLECGHIVQNIYLCVESLGMGCVASGGSYDQLDYLPLKKVFTEEAIHLYEVFIGHIDKRWRFDYRIINKW